MRIAKYLLSVCAAALLFAAVAAPLFSRPPAAQSTLPSNMTPEVQCVTGFDNIKPNTRGTLTFLPTGLQFTTEKEKGDITATSITDVFTASESRQDISGMVGTAAKAGVPYGGGRVLSLFSHRVEVLTIEYTDKDGGLHGAIFVLGKGKATDLKEKLIAEGAKTTTHVEAPAPPAGTPESGDQPKEQPKQ